MNSEVWLIGGYGDVGRTTAAALLKAGGFDVVLAGRDAQKARDGAQALGAPVRGETCDAAQGLPEAALSSAAAVINFVEAQPPVIAKQVVAAGGVYIDTSADPDHLAAVAATLPAGPGLAVINAGLAPGLTNILARATKQQHPEVRRIDSILEMGMGRHHGHAATAGTLRALGQPYRSKREGAWQTIVPGREKRKVRFGSGSAVPAIGFKFSDQIAMAERLDLDTARSFLALDPKSMTVLTGLLAGGATGKWIARRSDGLTRFLAKLPPSGGTATRLAVEGYDAAGKLVARRVIETVDQADVTAAMLALTVQAGLQSDTSGLVHLDELVTLEDAKAALGQQLRTIDWFD